MIEGRNSSEQMFRLYAALAQVEKQRDDLARKLEAAIDREAQLVGRFGEDGPETE